MFYLFFKLIVALIIILLMIYILIKLANNQKGLMGGDLKQIKILDRAQISKDCFIVIVKVRKKGYVISCTSNKSDIISELSEEDVYEIEKEQNEARQEMLNKYNNAALLLKKKLHIKNQKEDKKNE